MAEADTLQVGTTCQKGIRDGHADDDTNQRGGDR